MVSRRGLDDLDDAELMRRVERGDVDALGVLYGRHVRWVRSVVRRVLPVGGLDEEVVQDVFVELWRFPVRHDPSRGSLRTWLRVVAHGAAVDRWRHERSRPTGRAVPIFDEHDVEDWRLPAGPGADALAVESVVAGIVREAVAALPSGHREVLVLAYWSGLSVREIAVVLGVPEGTVKARTWDARERLRRLLGPLGRGLRC